MRDGFIQAEYLQLTGNEYINTWVKASGKTRIVLDVMQLDTSATFCFYCGARTVVDASNAYANVLFCVDQKYRQDFYGNSQSTTGAYGNNVRFTIDNNMGIVKIGSSYTLSMTSSSTTSNGPMLLGASYQYANSSITNLGNYAKLRIYSCQIYEDGTLIRDFVPCVEDNGNGNIGLYDKVNDIFYRPYGSGSPTSYISGVINGDVRISNSIKSIKSGYANINGAYKSIKSAYIFKNNTYTKLNYIESNGIQKIDTGIKPSDDLVTTIDFQCLSDGITENGIFGASWSISGYFLSAYKAGGGLRWHFGGVNIDVSADATQRHTCICSKSGLTVDGTAHTFSPTGSNGTNNIYIFTPSDTASIIGPELTYSGRYRLYSFKMTKGSTTIRDYIPVIRNSDGMIGLYEQIEHKFYSSCSSIDDKISYNNRSCIETTYSDADHVCNAMWTYNNTNNYAACAKLSMDSNGTISGNVYIADTPNSSDAITFIKYNYDHGYTVPFPYSTTNLSLVSITVSNSSGTILETKNASINVPSDKVSITFTADIPALISSLAGNYTLTINVSLSSTACKFTIPITKIATIGRYFTANDLDTYFELSSSDFMQSGHYYANGLELASDTNKYISCKKLIPIGNCDESGVTKTVTIISNSANGALGSDSGFIWYDARGSFISGIVATAGSDSYTITGIPPSTAKYFSINLHSANGITPNTITSPINIYTYVKNGNVYYDPSSQLFQYITYTDLVKISTDYKSVSAKAYTAESLVPTWTITSKVSGASYGFSLTSDGYYTSGNGGVNSSAALCRVNFTNNTGAAYTVKFNCINYAEANYDYGIIGKINTALATGNSADSTYTKSFKGSSSSSVQTVSLSVPTGTSWVDVKYLKDSSQSSNNDSLKFKITT